MSARVGLVPVVTSGIIGSVSSSRRARRRRRQAAQARHYRRLRKAGRVPQHSRAERQRAAAERARQREADQRREKLRGRIGLQVAEVVGVSSMAFFFGVSGLPVVHHQHPTVLPGSSAGVALPAPDMPHMPVPDGTYYTPIVAPGSADAASVRSLPGNPWWYSPYGPNLTGD